MEAKAKLFGHSIHQMLIPFPLGVLGMAVVFDVIALVGRWPSLHNAAFAMIGAGVISGLLAALFGVIDFLAIPLRTRAKRIGFLHGVGNVVMLLLFAASWWFRADAPHQQSPRLPRASPRARRSAVRSISRRTLAACRSRGPR